MHISKKGHMDSHNQGTDRLKHVFRFVAGTSLLLIVILAIWYTKIYTQTPPKLRMPETAHYHLRLQIINNGQPIDFTKDDFQTPYDKYSCSVDLPDEPIHFHDNLNQFVHIHWQGITGGMVLKNYGWNEIGGNDQALGYRFDRHWWPQSIPIHANVLPPRANKINYFLYTGDQTNHQLRNWQEFLRQDLEIFFNNTVALNTTNTPSTSTKMGTTKIKNLLGNAVLFVQENQPSDEEVQTYFNNLIPLPESTCGG